MRKRVAAALLALLCAMALVLPAAASVWPKTEGIDANNTIRLTLEYKAGSTPIPGVKFELYKVGTNPSGPNADNSYDFDVTSDFKSALKEEDLTGLKIQYKTTGSTSQMTELAAELAGYGSSPQGTHTTDDKGSLSFSSGLEPGLYLVRGEKKTIGGITYIPTAFLIPLPYPNAEEEAFKYKVTAKVKHTTLNSIAVTCVWLPEDEEHPKSVTVQLLRNGELYEEVTLRYNGTNRWTFNWPEMDLSDPNVQWTVKEKNVPDVYSITYKDPVIQNGNYSFEIINNREKIIDITAVKEWEPDDNNHPNSVTVHLLRDGKVYDDKTLSDGNGWKHTWTGLDSNSKWEVSEEVPAGYKTPVITDDGKNTFTIKNSRIPEYPRPEPINITVKKEWKPNGANHPDSITVRLLRDGKVYNEKMLNGGNGWEYTWTGLDPDSDWKVEEKALNSWKTAITRVGNIYTITNTYRKPGTSDPDPEPEPELNEISVQKKWEPEDADHPDSVIVQLFRDSSVYSEKTLNDSNGWKHAWTGLAQGFSWDVKEKDIPSGYTASITQRGNAFTIENRKTDNPELPANPGPPAPSEGGPTPSPTPSSYPTDPPTYTDGPTTPDIPTDPGDTPNNTGVPGLPQTGQLWWPVALLMALSVPLLLIGAVLFIRKEEK